jgi:hypothetical protein
MSDEAAASPASVTVSLFLAGSQAIVAAFVAFGVVVIGLDEGFKYEILLSLGCAAFESAAGVAYLCRSNVARLFLAGQFVVITIASALVGLVGVFVSGWLLLIAMAVPIAVGIAGSLAFVSVHTRQRCSA